MKYNIAIIGTFDCENFGDLMFPIVFRKQIEKRLEIDNLFLFSPNQCQMPLNPEKIQVYSIDKLEKIHNEYGLHGIVFGGGDLVRLDNAFAPQENYNPENTSFDLMIYSAVIANKYNIPYLWNCPGVPFEFLPSEQKIVRVLLDEFVDFISVREARSAEILKMCNCQSEIAVSPDTVLSIGSLIDKNENGIFDALCNEFNFLNEDYIVYQMAINRDAIGDFDNFKTNLGDQLKKLSENTKKKVVFLPIGNVHNDEKNILYLLSEFKNENFVTFDRKLNIYETNSILANATVFVGTSLHGNIVSNSYGVPSIGLDLYNFVKLKNYFKLIDRSEYCISDITDICNVYAKILQNGDINVLNFTMGNIDAHFDRIAKSIKNNSKKSGNIKNLLSLCFEHNKISRANNIVVYYDYGSGFCDQNTEKYEFSDVSHNFKLTLDVSENVKKIRIDPSDNAFCLVKDLKITSGTQKINYCGNFSQQLLDDNSLLFFNRDPQIVFDVDKETKIDIEFSVVSLFVSNSMDSDIKIIEDSLCDVENIAYSSMRNRDITIEKNETYIKKQQQIILAKDNEILNLTNSYNSLNAQYADIVNSFYWRLTALPRKITGKIKALISKHYSIMKILVFIKGFLKGGIKGGKCRVESYAAFVGKSTKTDDKLTIGISKTERKYQESCVFENSPKISILVPLYNTPENFLKEMIASVKEQTYKNWELCLADGSDNEHDNVQKYCISLATNDKRIKYLKLGENKGISENTNECLKMATGDYIALFDHDDLLHPSVLFEYVKVINEQKADFIYCDEATFVCEEKNNYKVVLKHHKPEFSPDTLRSYNYICHFTCFARYLYELVGNFNKEYDGSQDYDLILRLTEKAKCIVRIPKLLYFWRSHAASVASGASAKPYVVNSAEKALLAHLDRVGLKGTVKESYAPTTYKIDYEIKGNPLVSIIIPNKDHIDDLDKCVKSIISKSSYKNFEIIIVENNSTEQETFDYYKTLEAEQQNIKVVVWNETGFNYSKINNYGAKFANGEYILLLNNDIEVITHNWLEEMLMFAQRKDVGAVGSKLYFPDDTIQHAGVILGIGGVAGHAHKYFNRKDYGYVSRAVISQNLSACTAACLLIRKDVYDEIEGLDENFAVAFNDIDLCMKIRAAGYLIVFTPYAEFYHYESKSRGLEDSPEKVKRFNGEVDRFKGKWGEQLDMGDPYYNPNLTLEHENFSLK